MLKNKSLTRIYNFPLSYPQIYLSSFLCKNTRKRETKFFHIFRAICLILVVFQSSCSLWFYIPPEFFFFFKKSKLQILNLRLNKKQYKYEQYLAMHHSLTDSPIAINTRHQLFIFQSPLPVFP